MSDIVYRVGSATQPPERPAVIVHCTNNIGKWGAGFTAALNRDWSAARESFAGSGPMELGEVRVGRLSPRALGSPGLELWIAHCCGQRGVRNAHNPTPLELGWLKLALRRVVARPWPAGTSFHLPRIGCGLAGGTWDDVEPVVAATLGKSFPVFVYDLQPGGVP